MFVSCVLSVCLCFTGMSFSNSVQRAKARIRETTEWICLVQLRLTCHFINLLLSHVFTLQTMCVCSFSVCVERKRKCMWEWYALRIGEWLLLSKPSACRANSSVCGMRGHLDLWHQNWHNCVKWSTYADILYSHTLSEKMCKKFIFLGTAACHWSNTFRGAVVDNQG